MEEAQQVPNQNPVTPIPPIATYPAPQPNPTSKTPWMLISLIIILLGVASYFGYQNYQLKQQLSARQPTPTSVIGLNSPAPTTSPVVSTASTEDWKTYTSGRDKLGFEIKYPPSVKVSKEFNDQYNRATEFTGKDINFTVMLRSGYGIDIKNYFFMDAPISRTTTLAGVSANIYEMPNGYCDGPGCSAPYIAIVTVNGQDLYHISFFFDTKLSDIENQILSSFKFTN